MNPIERIIVATYKGDFWLAEICVASIRRWYPEIPILMLKDVLKGDFGTEEMECAYGVRVMDLPRNEFGWGVSKFEPLFAEAGGRMLILDADTLMVGRLLDALNGHSEDFIISPEHPTDTGTKWFRETYYELPRLNAEFDPDFAYPGFVFNTGQFVATPGRISQDDMRPFVDYGGRPRTLRPDIFQCADQGILNYLLPKMHAEGRLTLGRVEFMVWSLGEEAGRLDSQRIISGDGYPKLLHWAGDNSRCLDRLQRADLLRHFQKDYYSRIPLGYLKRMLGNGRRWLDHHYNAIFKQLAPRIARRLRKWLGICRQPNDKGTPEP